MLPHLKVTCVSKISVSGHMLYDIFDLFLSKESQCGELMREFRFALLYSLETERTFFNNTRKKKK
jgi:hypothetical protein